MTGWAEAVKSEEGFDACAGQHVASRGRAHTAGAGGLASDLLLRGPRNEAARFPPGSLPVGAWWMLLRADARHPLSADSAW